MRKTWVTFDVTKRRASAKAKLRYLTESAAKIPGLEVGIRLRQRIVDRTNDFEAGILSIDQIEKKIEEIADDYMIAVGEAPVSRKRR